MSMPQSDAPESQTEARTSEPTEEESPAAEAAPEPRGVLGDIWLSLRTEPWGPRAILAFFRDLYFTFDRRTLGFTRILLGFLLVCDLFHRGNAWLDMYSSIGVLPTQYNLQRPQAYGAFTIFNAFSSPFEVKVLWAVMFVVFFCLLIGFKTRVMQVLSLIFVTGMNGRILLIENGGYVVNNLLCLWTMFLPLGDRFSVDAMLASWRRERETTAAELNDRSSLLTEKQLSPHVTLLGLVLVIQIAAIYFFNVVHKTGPAWKNGTAVHYVLYVDRMVTPLIGLTRDYIPNWGIIFLTRSSIFCEAALPFACLLPIPRVWGDPRVWPKRAVVVMMNFIHIGFGASMVLGPFAWSCCVFSSLFFSREDWELATRTMRRSHRARTVLFDPKSGGALLVCRLLKRLDRFELLTFEAREGLPIGLAVVDPLSPDDCYDRADAIADIVAALPLGPSVAWLFRVPGLRQLTDAILGALESRDASRAFGLKVGTSKLAAGASPLRRGAGWFPATFRELAIAAMFAGALNQAAVELWCINRRWKVPQPEPLALLSHKMRFLQGWFMFSPNPVMDDGTIVVDAITTDGRHIDPFTGKPPNFDLGAAKSLGLTQIWCDYFNRIQLPGNTAYREPMKDYMYRLPQRTGNPNDAIVSGDVYWIKDLNPRWNEKKSYGFEKSKLFSFENPAAKAQASR